MADRAAPLNHSVRIVDADGYPTPDFIRLWQEQTLGTPTSSTELSAYLDLIASTANAILVRGAVGWTSSIAPGDATKFLNGATPPAWAAVKDTDVSLSDETTQNATSTRHGFLKKLNNDTTMFMRGDGTWAKATDADLATSDITTNDVSTTKHGFAPKAPNDATKYLDGTGAWSTPAGGGGGGGGMTLIDSFTATSDTASVSFTSIPGTYNALIIFINGRLTSSGREVRMTFNGDSGSNYSWFRESRFGYSQSGSVAYMEIGSIPNSGDSANFPGSFNATIPYYADTVLWKSAYSTGSLPFSSTSMIFQTASGWWYNTAAITQIDLVGSSGNFKTGTSIFLYGV